MATLGNERMGWLVLTLLATTLSCKN